LVQLQGVLGEVPRDFYNMIERDVLVCGTRKKGYKELVFSKLDELFGKNKETDWNSVYGLPISIIDGCCPDSADSYAEEWANDRKVKVQHHPSKSGNYLKRNIEMVYKADMVIAFWDGYSYGTAHTIAWATHLDKEVIIFFI